MLLKINDKPRMTNCELIGKILFNRAKDLDLIPMRDAPNLLVLRRARFKKIIEHNLFFFSIGRAAPLKK